MKAEIEDGKILIFGGYNLREQLKSIGARWNKKRKAWWLSHDFDSVEALRQYFGLKVPPPEMPVPAQIPARFVLGGLYSHQRVSVEKARGLPYFADFSEPGTGKTLVQIELMLERDEWPVLIICPKSINHAVWGRQLRETFQFKEQVHILEGGSKKVIQQIEKIKQFCKYNLCDHVIAVINYEMVPRVLDELLEVSWKAIIADESTRVKNPSALRSKALIKLRDIPTVKFRAIMTGTPAPNGLLDIFNQIRFLDSRLFGESWYAFRQRYMEQKPWDKWNWYPREGAYSAIKERLAKFSVAHKKRECVDLPPLVHEERYVDLTPAQAQAYRQMRDELLVELASMTVVAPFTITKLMKLRQIASGFLYGGEGTAWLGSNKPAELLDLFDELDNEQVIVFTHFRETSRLLHDILSQKKIDHVWITSDLKDKAEQVKKFENGEARILLANTAVMAHGWNLQFCSNVVFYEHDFALENYEQAVQRIERIGQQNKMTVWHLLTNDTLEKKILERLREKIDLNRALDVASVKELIT